MDFRLDSRVVGLRGSSAGCAPPYAKSALQRSSQQCTGAFSFSCSWLPPRPDTTSRSSCTPAATSMQLVHAVDTLCFRRQRRNKAEALWTRWAEHSRVGSRTLSRGLQAITSACHPHVCGLSPSRTLTSVLYVTRTGNEEYQFGDFTRSAVEGTKVGVEDAVKKVTGNEEYQCNIDSNL